MAYCPLEKLCHTETMPHRSHKNGLLGVNIYPGPYFSDKEKDWSGEPLLQTGEVPLEFDSLMSAIYPVLASTHIALR